ncbi:peroxidase family protein [Pirellulimonas nuda]|uniref:peroxidase family protein n=1 Tax=Pirellulimonas nuda TaxID=2528009 RepID=UPI001E4DA90D|nr:peroxidase family protein [Pirellulimonas nuda]
MSYQTLESRQMLAADLAGVSDAADQQTLLDWGVAAAQSDSAAVYSVDGAGNNLANPLWGSTGIALQRLTTAEYADGLSEAAGADRPSAREVSNTLADQTTELANDRQLTDFVWLWGQFIDHDIDLTDSADPAEALPIEVPEGDADFVGVDSIGLSRSEYVVDEAGVRQQVSSITAYIDGSMIYGSDQATSDSLRSFEGGRMLTSEGDLLPTGDGGFFLAGDIRANENVALTSMHTLWVREHNRLAGEIAAADPSLSDEEVYQAARSIVIAQVQAITYNQWLPALLGIDAIEDYQGYDPAVNATIANVFSTAAYRFGHSMLSAELLRLDSSGNVASSGNLALADAFFAPDQISQYGIDGLLAGAAQQLAQEVDPLVVDGVRNFLFGAPGAGGFDLVSLNIQRGRDHGLADYNQTRIDYGLAPVTSFDQITSDPELASKLEQLYGSVDDIDAWVGVLAEDHASGSSLGELGRTIIADQFSRLRDGDRLWYQNTMSGEALAAIERVTLADVIMRNTEVSGLRENVFFGEGVFYYAHQTGDAPLDATLTVAGDQVRLVDNRTSAVLHSQLAQSVEQIVLVGGRGSDTIRLAASIGALDLPGGIAIDGLAGTGDTLVVDTTQGRDVIAIDGALMSLGAAEVQFDGIELVRIRAGQNDSIQVADDTATRVVVDREGVPRPAQSPQGPQRPAPRGPIAGRSDGAAGRDPRLADAHARDQALAEGLADVDRPKADDRGDAAARPSKPAEPAPLAQGVRAASLGQQGPSRRG